METQASWSVQKILTSIKLALIFPLDDEATVLAHLFVAPFPAPYEAIHLSSKAKAQSMV